MGVLRFRLLGFPVSVHPGFWLFALLLGLLWSREPAALASWTIVLFGAVLLHELGHALLARRFGGGNPEITVRMMGGLTSWQPSLTQTRGQHALVALAGPGAGLLAAVLGVLVYIAVFGDARPEAAESATFAQTTVELWVFANGFLSVLNLLPILPFDGGQVLAAALGPRRSKLTAMLSLGFSGVAVAAFLSQGWWLPALVFGLGGVDSYLRAQRAAGRPPVEALRALLAKARELLDAEHYADAHRLAAAVVGVSDEPELRCAALEVAAWSALLAGRPDVADHALTAGGDHAFDPLLVAATHVALGRADAGMAVLERARADGDHRPELLGQLVRVQLEAGRVDGAIEMALQIADDAPEDDLRTLAERATAASAHGGAAALWERLFARTCEPRDAFEATRSHARAGELDRALSWLERALGAGWDADSARRDSALSALVDDARFEQVLAGRQ